jgi:hypothetical protein
MKVLLAERLGSRRGSWKSKEEQFKIIKDDTKQNHSN